MLDRSRTAITYRYERWRAVLAVAVSVVTIHTPGGDSPCGIGRCGFTETSGCGRNWRDSLAWKEALLFWGRADVLFSPSS
jgi:hypothetical protein